MPSHLLQYEKRTNSLVLVGILVMLTSREDILWKLNKEHLSHASVNIDTVILDIIWTEFGDKGAGEFENI